MLSNQTETTKENKHYANWKHVRISCRGPSPQHENWLAELRVKKVIEPSFLVYFFREILFVPIFWGNIKKLRGKMFQTKSYLLCLMII
jgi:hypothetical protein